jgi:folate-binding Fe-S cluster repair protein YgfZ
MATAYFNRFTIGMTKAQALSASHSGRCDEDVAALTRNPRIASQLRHISAKDIRAELKEYGAWSNIDLEDDEENKHRIVWIAACNIREEG